MALIKTNCWVKSNWNVNHETKKLLSVFINRFDFFDQKPRERHFKISRFNGIFNVKNQK